MRSSSPAWTVTYEIHSTIDPGPNPVAAARAVAVIASDEATAAAAAVSWAHGHDLLADPRIDARVVVLAVELAGQSAAEAA